MSQNTVRTDRIIHALAIVMCGSDDPTLLASADGWVGDIDSISSADQARMRLGLANVGIAAIRLLLQDRMARAVSYRAVQILRYGQES